MTETNSMPPEVTRSSILKGQKALIVGVANDRSIAWGCAEAMHRSGAEIAMTYLNDRGPGRMSSRWPRRWRRRCCCRWRSATRHRPTRCSRRS